MRSAFVAVAILIPAAWLFGGRVETAVPVAVADDCPRGHCTPCRCVSPEICDRGACPTYSPFPLPPPEVPVADVKVADSTASTAYATAVRRVEAGETVYLCVGVPIQDGCGHVDSLSGFTPGVYRCFLANGRPVMERGKWSLVRTCNGGSCSVSRVWVRE